MLPQTAPNIASAAAPIEGPDHISNLPEGVLQHILSLLPAQDVVRTCVLAKRWRHLWKSTTVLSFVLGELGGLGEPASTEQIEFVDQLLRLRIRQDMPLDTCEFLVEEEDFDMSRIVFWIRLALHCKVRVLRLNYSFGFRLIPSLNSHPFFISQFLKVLELQGLEMLPNLDFSCCPNLEDLYIYECHTTSLGELISSQSLKRLTIVGCLFDYRWRLPICAPNLVSLWLELECGCFPSLQRMPSLQTAVVKIFDKYVDLGSYGSNQSIVLQSLSEVQNLVLISPYTNMPIFRRDLKSCYSFNKLKSLLLDEYWCEPADFSALACLLKLSPVLEKLTLQLYSEGPNHKVEIKLSCKPLEISVAISQHFKTLEVKCEVYDDRVHNVLTFLSKQLNICFSSADRLCMRMDQLSLN